MKFKDLRMSKKFYKQKDFARLIGVKPSTLSAWETGIAKPNKFIIPKIADVLGVSAEEVISCFKQQI